MTDYALALFLHILGALGLLVANGIEWVTIGQLHRVRDVTTARVLAGQLRIVRLIGPVSLLVLLGAGVYLTLTRSGWQPWVLASLVALVAILMPLGAFNGIRLSRTLERLSPSDGNMERSVIERLRDPRHIASVRVRVAVFVAIVYLMVAKPDLAVAVAALVVAVGIGIATSVPAWRTEAGPRADVATS